MASVSAMEMGTTYTFDRRGKASVVDDFMYGTNVAQAHIYIRMGFLRKVYGILTVQLLITTVVAGAAKFSSPIRAYISQNPWTLSVGLLLSLVILLALHVYRRKTPVNYFLLGAFTLVEAYSIGVVVTFYDQLVVLQAFFLTGIVTLGLTLYTLQSKKDFSSCGAGLFVALCVLLIGGIAQVFLNSSYLELLLASGGALIFSMFLVYDTQTIMHNLSPEEYILATITLYLDIFNLFLHLLRFLEAIKRG